MSGHFELYPSDDQADEIYRILQVKCNYLKKSEFDKNIKKQVVKIPIRTTLFKGDLSFSSNRWQLILENESPNMEQVARSVNRDLLNLKRRKIIKDNFTVFFT